MTDKPRCSECGHFIRWDDLMTVAYTPYGNPTDLDPPEDELLVCSKCWERKPAHWRRAINEIAWRGPYTWKSLNY